MKKQEPFSEEAFPELAYVVARIKDARAEKGWSQRRLAEELGITAGHVGHIEGRALNLTLSTIARIAAVLEKPLAYFFPEENLRAAQVPAPEASSQNTPPKKPARGTATRRKEPE